MTDDAAATSPLRVLTPKPLTVAAFKPYGEVISVDAAVDARSINEGHTTRFHDLAQLDLAKEGGRPVLSIFRTRPKPLPIEIKVMERHPIGSQAFFPLSGRPYLVVVATETPENINVFLAGPQQGVNYGANTWHHYSLALEGESDFLVVDRDGPGTNLEEVHLAPEHRVLISLSALS